MVQNVMPVAFLSCAKARRRRVVQRQCAIDNIIIGRKQSFSVSRLLISIHIGILSLYTPERDDTGRETNETVVDRRATTANHLFRSIIITHTLVYTYIAACRARPDRFPIGNRKSYYTRYIINTATATGQILRGGGCTVRRPCTIFLGPLQNIKKPSFSESVVARVKSVHKSDVFTPRRVRTTFKKKIHFSGGCPVRPKTHQRTRDKRKKHSFP